MDKTNDFKTKRTIRILMTILKAKIGNLIPNGTYRVSYLKQTYVVVVNNNQIIDISN